MVSGYHNSTKGLADQFWAQREPARKETILASNLRQGRAEETQTCVARRYCCRFEMRGSYTDCFFISGHQSSQRLLSREEIERTIFPSSLTINAQPWILLRDLPAANLCEVFYRRETAVFCQSERDSVERGGKGSHGVLFDRGNLLQVYEKLKRTGSQLDIHHQRLLKQRLRSWCLLIHLHIRRGYPRSCCERHKWRRGAHVWPHRRSIVGEKHHKRVLKEDERERVPFCCFRAQRW